MYNVIEFSESVRVYDRVSEYSSIKSFNSLENIFKEYIDIEWWKDFSCKDEIGIDDVLNMKDDIGVMSVNEDMSLYIFKSDDVCNLIEDYVFELGMRVKVN
tara:strand:- start:101 stop:403 length:303 start_codon:yes stop_codon:yes gene_type:complete